jgi:hypothetical protein
LFFRKYRFSFAKDFVSGPENAIRNSDLVAVIHDVSNSVLRHKLDPRVVNVLKEFPDKNAILILNKVFTKETNALVEYSVFFMLR